jgi:hypothetical protein
MENIRNFFTSPMHSYTRHDALNALEDYGYKYGFASYIINTARQFGSWTSASSGLRVEYHDREDYRFLLK